MTTVCPVEGCHSVIVWGFLVCHWHWKRLPGHVRAYLSLLHKTEAGSQRELEAILNALEYLNERQMQGARA
jgi:hypothetical protein